MWLEGVATGSADTLPSRTLQRLGRELQQLQRREAQLRAEHGRLGEMFRGLKIIEKP